VVEFIRTVITRDGGECTLQRGSELPEGAVMAVLMSRSGAWQTRALIRGFLPYMDGMATTYNTTAELLALGRDPRSTAAAARRVRELGGGFAIAREGRVVWEYAWPVVGIMSPDPFDRVRAALEALEQRVAAAGYGYDDIWY